MSNWITDNKPAAVVAGVGLLLFLGLSTMGYIANSNRSKLDEKIKAAANTIKSANSATITPSSLSNENLEKELQRYTKALSDLETAYKPFLASSALVPTTPTEFQNKLKAFRESLIASCKGKNILITDTSSWLGFQLYSTKAPSVQAAPTLDFELKAINNLVNKLTECGLTKFIKVYRPQISIENSSNKAEEEPDEANQCSWVPMPLEIAFQGNRESVLKAMNIITGSQDYLFTVNSVRIRNERMMPPPIANPAEAQATTSQPTTTQSVTTQPATSQPATGAASLTPADEEVAPAEPAVRQVVKPYMGKEQIFVQVSLNLVHFSQPKEQESSED